MTEKIRLDEVLEELYILREENQSLRLDNDFLQRQNSALKIRCSRYSQDIHRLESENADLKFGNELKADLEETAFIEEGETHYYKVGTAIYGDDF